MSFPRPGRFKDAIGQFELQVATKKIEEAILILDPHLEFLAMVMPTRALAMLALDLEIGKMKCLQAI